MTWKWVTAWGGEVVHAAYTDLELLCGNPGAASSYVEVNETRRRKGARLKHWRFCKRCAHQTDERPDWLQKD